jgi:hypothetical protein
VVQHTERTWILQYLPTNKNMNATAHSRFASSRQEGKTVSHPSQVVRPDEQRIVGLILFDYNTASDIDQGMRAGFAEVAGRSLYYHEILGFYWPQSALSKQLAAANPSF